MPAYKQMAQKTKSGEHEGTEPLPFAGGEGEFCLAPTFKDIQVSA